MNASHCHLDTTIGCPKNISLLFGMGIDVSFSGSTSMSDDFCSEHSVATVQCDGPVYFGSAPFHLVCIIDETGDYEWQGLEDAENGTFCQLDLTIGCPKNISTSLSGVGFEIDYGVDTGFDVSVDGTAASVKCLGPAYISTGVVGEFTCKHGPNGFYWYGLDAAENETFCKLDLTVGCPRNISDSEFGNGTMISYSDGGTDDIAKEGTECSLSCAGPKFIAIGAKSSITFTCEIDDMGNYFWLGLDSAPSPFCECACYCPAP